MSWWQVVFGKLVQSSASDAAIINGFEHQIIGYSADTPDAVMAACYPSVTGIGATEQDPWDKYPWREDTGGLIISPVVSGNQAYWIVGRVGCRREQGLQGRYYTQAYYLAISVNNLDSQHLWGLKNVLQIPMLTQKQTDLPSLTLPAQDLPFTSELLDSLLPLLSQWLSGQPIHSANEQDLEVFLNQAFWLLHCLPPAIRWRLPMGHHLYRVQPHLAMGQGYLLPQAGAQIAAVSHQPYVQAYLQWFTRWARRAKTLSELQTMMADKLRALQLSIFNQWDGLDIQLTWEQALMHFCERIEEHHQVERMVMWLYTVEIETIPFSSLNLRFFQSYFLNEVLDTPEFPYGLKIQELLPLFLHSSWRNTWQTTILNENDGERRLQLLALAITLGHEELREPQVLPILQTFPVPESLWQTTHQALLKFSLKSLNAPSQLTHQALWNNFLDPEQSSSECIRVWRHNQSELLMWLIFHHLVPFSQTPERLLNLSTHSLSLTLRAVLRGKTETPVSQLMLLIESLKNYQLPASDLDYLLTSARQNQNPHASLAFYCLLHHSLPISVISSLLYEMPTDSYPVVDWVFELFEAVSLSWPALELADMPLLTKILDTFGRHYEPITNRLLQQARQPEDIYLYFTSLADKEPIGQTIPDRLILSALRLQLDARDQRVITFWQEQTHRHQLSHHQKWQLFVTDTQSLLGSELVSSLLTLEGDYLLAYVRQQHPISPELMNKLDLRSLFPLACQIKSPTLNELVSELRQIQLLFAVAQQHQAQEFGVHLFDYLLLNYLQHPTIPLKIKHFKTLKGTVQGTPSAIVLNLFEQAATLAAYDNRMRLERISELTSTRFGAWSKFNFLEKSFIVIGLCLGMLLVYVISDKTLLWWQSPKYKTLENQLEVAAEPLSLNYIQRYLEKDKSIGFNFYLYDIKTLSLVLSSKHYAFRLPTPNEILAQPSEKSDQIQEIAKDKDDYYICGYSAQSKPDCTVCDSQCKKAFAIKAQNANQKGFRLVRERLK